MNNNTQQNNVKYNVRIIDEIVDILRKKTSFNDIISKEVRERILSKGVVEKTKINRLCSETKIEKEYFTGEKRFIIPDCEVYIEHDINALQDIDKNIPGFMHYVAEMVKTFELYEFIEDENLERMIYFIKNDCSMKGYAREKANSDKMKLKKLCIMLESMDNRELIKADTNLLTKFIKLAEEKVIISKAGLILNKK